MASRSTDLPLGERERWQIRLSRTYGCFADKVDEYCASPLALPLFTLAFAIGLPIDVDRTNIGVSYFTAALVLLGLGSARRDRKAMHHKLDDLEISIPEAASDNAGIEALTEAEIEAIRLSRRQGPPVSDAPRY